MKLENAKVTVVITPRDRYSGVIECIENLYAVTDQPFYLKVLDLRSRKGRHYVQSLVASVN